MPIFRHSKRRQPDAAATRLHHLQQVARLRNILARIDPDGFSHGEIAALAGAEGYPTTADRVAAIHDADFAAVQDITPAEIDAIDWATARLDLSQAIEAYNRNVSEMLPAKIMDIYPRLDLSTPDGMRDFAQTLPNIAGCVALADEIEQRHKSNGSDTLR
jgi:hypothetical protein